MKAKSTVESSAYTTAHPSGRSVRIRELARHVALSTLAKAYEATGQMGQALKRNRIQFLYLHFLFQEDKNSFRKLLKKLSDGHDFISYSEAATRILSGDIDRPYIALSFDDGLKNCLNAAEIMNEFGIKACFFVCASMTGETDSEKIRAFCLEKMAMPPMEFLSWDDVDSLLKAGHEIGSHTMMHPNLAELSRQQLQHEIGGSYQLLTQKVGTVRHFAWPFGRFSDFSPVAARIVFETGFTSCASAERGCHVEQAKGHEKDLCIRRDNTEVRWPLDHILYFMARNSHLASALSNRWPAAWSDTSQ